MRLRRSNLETAAPDAPPLPGSVTDYLLTGDFLCVHESRRRGIDDTYDGWAPLVDLRFSDMAAVWREHREALMVEWQRRGGIGEPWAAKQFDQPNDNPGDQ